MTFGDILSKLLPFSYIKEDGTTGFDFKWQQLTDGDIIITSVEMLLIVVFVLFMYKLFTSFWQDRKDIIKLESLLKDYHGYNQFVEDISENEKLKYLWNSFDKTLIKNNNDENIKSLVDVEYFFNKNSMITHLGSKMFSSIPGIFLGIGLLGTFFGLYFALIQMDMSTQQKFQSSIETLINMAGVKFSASIWGLGLSVIFTFVDKLLEMRLENRVLKVQKLLSEQFPKQAAEKNLNDIRIQNEQQTKALNGLATSLTEKISAEFNATLIPKLELLNSQFASMPQQISHSINETFQKPLEKLSNTVESITANQTDKSNEVMQNMLTEFIKELKSSAGDEGERLKTISKQSQEVLTQTSSQLQDTFKSMQQIFQQQQTVAKERDEQILKDLSQIKNDQKDMIESLSSSVKENITQLSEVMQTTVLQQQTSMQQREEQMAAKIYEVVTNMEKNIVTSNEYTKEMFNKLIIQFDNHIDKIKTNIENILLNLKTEVQNIDTIMSSTSQKLISLPQHLEKVSQSADTLLMFSDDMRNSIDNLLKINTQFNEAQSSLTQYTNNLTTASKHLELADESLKDTLQISQELLKDMKTEFGDLADKNSDTLDEFSKKVDTFMNDYHQHVEQFIKNEVIHQLDNSLGDYAHKMGEAILELSDAIDELREKEIK